MQNKNFVWIVAMIAATAGLLFGFDTGVISGAIPFLQEDFGLTNSEVENLTTFGLLGAIIGAIGSGRVCDKIGRKPVLTIAAILFVTGALFCCEAGDLTMLIIARFYLGIAIGIASFSAPLYIAEISPARIRGTLVSMFQLLITIGLLGAFVSNSVIADNNNPESWRQMFFVGVIPGIILLLGMLVLPESPRWQIAQGREEAAIKTLQKIEDPENVDSEIERMKGEIKNKESEMGIAETFKQKWMIYPLMLAVMIMFFQQAVGINTVIYYGPSIFLKAGFEGNEAAIMASVSVGVVNVLFTILSLFLIDKLGRRKLFFIGMIMMCITLSMISYSFANIDNLGKTGTIAIVVSMLLYIASFAVSMGPLGWVLITEVFPTKVRGVGSSIGSLSNWGFNSLVVWTFYKLTDTFSAFGNENTGTAGVFGLFAIITIIGMIWGYKYLPETKGKRLEDIENHWKNGGKPNEL